MDMQQAQTIGLVQLTELCDPLEPMLFKTTHWLIKQVQHREITNFAWLNAEKQRIRRDPARVAFLVANETETAYALFVNCVANNCDEKKHDHLL